ncbi:MAG: hypothetical protein KF895_02910 [Parvibaculum sp.]|nr:hypothetical protein [Parvibaculum sp.]
MSAFEVTPYGGDETKYGQGPEHLFFKQGGAGPGAGPGGSAMTPADVQGMMKLLYPNLNMDAKIGGRFGMGGMGGMGNPIDGSAPYQRFQAGRMGGIAKARRAAAQKSQPNWQAALGSSYDPNMTVADALAALGITGGALA